MSRNNKILLRLTSEEYNKIKQKAERNGMKLAVYIRFICLTNKLILQKSVQE
jgi:predicted DNA binding CopG/RHH family protein